MEGKEAILQRCWVFIWRIILHPNDRCLPTHLRQCWTSNTSAWHWSLHLDTNKPTKDAGWQLRIPFGPVFYFAFHLGEFSKAINLSRNLCNKIPPRRQAATALLPRNSQLSIVSAHVPPLKACVLALLLNALQRKPNGHWQSWAPKAEHPWVR